MSADCGACFAKYLLCLFNFVFFIAGSVVLSIGIWIAADKSSFIQVTKIVESTSVVDGRLSQFTQPNAIEQFAYVLIAAGAFVFLVSFLGYCGALRESRCLLACYGIALIIISILEISAAGIVIGYRERVEIEARKLLKSSIRDYYTTPDRADAATVFWDTFMVQLQCCGVDNYRDFADSQFKLKGNMTVPKACCLLVGDVTNTQNLQPKDPRCPYSPNEANSNYMRGCYGTLVNLLLDHANIAIGIGIGIGVVQLLGIFLAFCLCKSISRYLK